MERRKTAVEKWNWRVGSGKRWTCERVRRSILRICTIMYIQKSTLQLIVWFWCCQNNNYLEGEPVSRNKVEVRVKNLMTKPQVNMTSQKR